MRKVEDSLFKDSVASEKSHLCSQVQVLTTNTTFLPQLLLRPSCAASFGLGSHLLSSTRGDEAFSILEERQRTHTTRELTTEMNLFFFVKLDAYILPKGQKHLFGRDANSAARWKSALKNQPALETARRVPSSEAPRRAGAGHACDYQPQLGLFLCV